MGVEVLGPDGGDEAVELIADEVLLVGSAVPGQLRQELEEGLHDLRVGSSVSARLGDGDVDQGLEVGATEDLMALTRK